MTEYRQKCIENLKQMRETMLESENWENLKGFIEAVTLGGMGLQRLTEMEKQIDFIYGWLAEIWDVPCNYGFDEKDVADEMHEKREEWCEGCNEHDAKDCWKKYLEMKYEESEAKE